MNTDQLAHEATHANAHLQNEGEYSIISSFGAINKEYAAIRGSVGIFDFSTHGKFRITGDEHVSWVSRLVSRDLEFLNSETTVFALCLNEAGEVLGIITLYKYDDAILIETETANRAVIAAWFESQRTEDIKIEDVSNRLALIGLEGPQSFKVAKTLLDFEISSVPFQGFVEVDYNGETIVLARSGYTGEYGYKIFVSSDSAVKLWQQLYAKVQELGGSQCGNDALEITMLEVRQPIGRLEGKGMPVIAAGLGWLVDFNKSDDYSGREAITEQCEATVERRTVGFITDEYASIKSNDPIMLDGQEIGHVIAAFHSLTLKATLGLALNNEPFTVPGLAWSIQNGQGEMLSARSVSSPYIVPKSWKVKML